MTTTCATPKCPRPRFCGLRFCEECLLRQCAEDDQRFGGMAPEDAPLYKQEGTLAHFNRYIAGDR